MSLRSKLEEAVICLKTGRVTLPYPAQPQPAPENFRGRPVWNAAKCIGCAGCANNCPSRAILVSDPCQELRILTYAGRRCTYCGRCADLCPEKAITMSREFELATGSAGDLQQRLDLFMSTCQRCGRCFTAASVLDALKMKGYRDDDLERERWVFHARGLLDEAAVGDIKIELD